MKALSQKRQTMKVIIIFLFCMSFTISAYGDISFSGVKGSYFGKLPTEDGYSPFLAIDSNNSETKSLLPATGFVLCEVLNLGNTRLNVCFLKKDITTESILDIKRLFLEVKLDF